MSEFRGGYIFSRATTYAVRPSTLVRPARAGKLPRDTTPAHHVLREAARHPEAVRHLVEQGYTPAPPVVLHGLQPNQLVPEYDRRLADARAPYGMKTRRIRPDCPTLLGEVHSYPAWAHEWQREDCQRWIKAVCDHRLEELTRHGGEVLAIYLHLDEPRVHLHVLAVSTDAAMQANPLHAGWRAAVEAEKAGAPMARRRRLMAEGLRAWVDNLWLALGAPFGLARLGPRIRRLLPHEHRADRSARVVEAEARRQAGDTIRRAEEARQLLEERAAEIAAGQQALAQAAKQLEQERRRMRRGTGHLLRLLADNPTAAQEQAQTFLARLEAASAPRAG